MFSHLSFPSGGHEVEDRKGGGVRQGSVHVWGEEVQRAGGAEDVGDELLLCGAGSQEECPRQAELVLTDAAYMLGSVVYDCLKS